MRFDPTATALIIAASMPLVKLAYRIAIDAHRTLMPLSHPPHVIAAASLYLALQLTQAVVTPYESPYDPSVDLAAFSRGWEESAACDIADVEGARRQCRDDAERTDVCHSVLDLFSSMTSSKALSATSPSDAAASPADPIGLSVISVDFVQVKIRLREHERARAESGSGRKRRRADDGAEADPSLAFLGRDDVSVRFKWREESPVGR